MYQKLEIFQTAHAMARHAGKSQAVTATNVANADTPGYRAQKMPVFADVWKKDPASTLKTTRAGHLSPSGDAQFGRSTDGLAEPSPNGNAVSIEEELMNAVNFGRQHNRALAVYRHGMTVLTTALGS